MTDDACNETLIIPILEKGRHAIKRAFFAFFFRKNVALEMSTYLQISDSIPVALACFGAEEIFKELNFWGLKQALRRSRFFKKTVSKYFRFEQILMQVRWRY